MKPIGNNSSLSRILRRKTISGGFTGFTRGALFDWPALVIGFFALNLVLMGVSVLIYRQIDNGEIFLSDKKEQTALHTLDKFALEQVVTFFDKKHEQFESLMGAPLTGIDPFIPTLVPKR
ncbi:MAG: hypothetical protein Q7R54_00040 [bacterium]|nr:hypothetical protein [bacterium]